MLRRFFEEIRNLFISFISASISTLSAEISCSFICEHNVATRRRGQAVTMLKPTAAHQCTSHLVFYNINQQNTHLINQYFNF